MVAAYAGFAGTRERLWCKPRPIATIVRGCLRYSGLKPVAACFKFVALSEILGKSTVWPEAGSFLGTATEKVWAGVGVG